ncbi:nitrogen regulation protein NR(II) [Halorussus sp. MSC15.2]|uniref:two-component system sensor histidine kinase NtrB n=1 Tax=Halorussus sp. MSC15.2 TaxID=2283638 RepID=UPI0013D8B2F5|nr:PAS domain-containing sensor histidine kinase [Halorussus sp. MSC15.2]NEU58320.1 PAS domain S-box protein [Halorussus sp. MSC15.2]
MTNELSMETPPSTPTEDPDDAGERRKAFDALAEASADGIVMLDDDSVVRYANPAVERILGYAPDQLVGEPLLTIIPDRFKEAHTSAFQQYLDTGERQLDWTYIELPGYHEEGHEVPLAISFNEFEHDDDHYFVGTFRDISKRKEAERRLERQNERLDQFASMLAHELRNPLEIAQIYLDFLDDGDEATIAEIATALDRIDEIIEMLLVLARSHGGVGDRESVDLATAATEAWEDTATGDADIELTTSLTIRANSTHLQSLFENLFRNSVEHSDGTVTVRVGTIEGGFYVEDTGPGIPEDKRETVTEAGYTTDEDGIGLGLTFVAQLADAYEWEFVVAESQEGGARFEFTDVEIVTDD